MSEARDGSNRMGIERCGLGLLGDPSHVLDSSWMFGPRNFYLGHAIYCHTLSGFHGSILDGIVHHFDLFCLCHLSIERVGSIGECSEVRCKTLGRQGLASRKALPYSIDTGCSWSCKRMWVS